LHADYTTAHDRLTEYMRRKGLKLTRQRETILRAFLSGQKHVAIDELLGATRKLHPGVGHATVYRTMKLFVEAGIAHEHNFSDGPAQYEPAHAGDDEHHDHLICTACDRIIEFENAEIEVLQDQVATTHGFRLTDHRMQLFGVCEGMATKGVCSRD
jgi:Fur family transcriptional regulator, ferric uptake regulator